MSDPGVPEWFIGGPLHGDNKLTTCPDNGSHEVRTVQYNHGGQLDDSPVHTEYSYRRTRFALGRTTLTLWVLYGMEHLDVGDRLAEILLAPHRDKEASGA